LPWLLLALCSKWVTVFIGEGLFAFSFLGMFLSFVPSSGLLPDDRFGSGSNSPDEAQ